MILNQLLHVLEKVFGFSGLQVWVIHGLGIPEVCLTWCDHFALPTDYWTVSAESVGSSPHLGKERRSMLQRQYDQGDRGWEGSSLEGHCLLAISF